MYTEPTPSRKPTAEEVEEEERRLLAEIPGKVAHYRDNTIIVEVMPAEER